MVQTTFPRDLIQAQRQRTRTYAALERRPHDTVGLRRRLRRLDIWLATHPFWRTQAGRSPSARVELRERIREIEAVEERLTDQHQRILVYIREFTAEHGGSPSLREIGKAVGLSSTSSVAHQLDQLEQLGALDRDPGRNRGITTRW